MQKPTIIRSPFRCPFAYLKFYGLWGRRRKKSSLKLIGPSFPGITSRSSLIRKRNDYECYNNMKGAGLRTVGAPLSPIVWLVSFQGQCESDEPEEPTVTTASCPASTVSVSVPIVPPPIPSNVPISTLLTPPIPLKFYGMGRPLKFYGPLAILWAALWMERRLGRSGA